MGSEIILQNKLTINKLVFLMDRVVPAPLMIEYTHTRFREGRKKTFGRSSYCNTDAFNREGQ